VSTSLTWTATDVENTMRIVLQGSVNEDADFESLLATIKTRQHVVISLKGIGALNSCGVREWVNFVREIPAEIQIELEDCSPVVVSQLNMISNFVGHAKIVSVVAPFICDSCGNEEERILNVADGTFPELTGTTCGKCHDEMVFDDIEDSYFAFLDAGT